MVKTYVRVQVQPVVLSASHVVTGVCAGVCHIFGGAFGSVGGFTGEQLSKVRVCGLPVPESRI